MTDLNHKSNNKSDEKPIVIRNTTDLQRLKLEKLMKNPDKPVVIPERPKGRSMPTVPDFVRNVMGSSAGAGSGEFHVYRHLRRKEYARQKFIQEKSEKEKLNDEYHQKLENNRKMTEEKTAKNRAKRLKRKMRAKQKSKKPKIEQKSESSDEQSSENSDNEELKETIENQNIKKEIDSGEETNKKENVLLPKIKIETPQNDDKETCQNDGKETTKTDEKVTSKTDEKETPQNDEKETTKTDEKGTSQNDEKETPKNDEKETTQNDEKLTLQNDEKEPLQISEEKCCAE